MKRVAGLIVLILVMCLALTGCSSSSSGGSSSGTGKKNTCGYCGKSYSAGDSGGNYMNIARTRLCNSCYALYKSRQ